MSDEAYNGWTNRETWAAHLWLTNDEGFHDDVREIRADCRSVAELAVRLKGYLCDYADLSSDPMFATKAVQRALLDIGSLWRVNWDEIAAALAEDAP